jgi:transcriptional regulator with XRE-family HTH domain
VVRAVVNQLLNERFAPRQPNAGQPFWKQSAPTPETVAAQNALNQERQALFEALLGPDARPSAVLDEAARQRRYGSLADEKIDAVARIERDYSEMTAETWAKRRGNIAISTDTMMETQRLMEQEKLADLATILSPEELAAYERRNSPSARNLMNGLHNVEITEDEFARLFEAQKSFDEAHAIRGTMDQQTYMRRLAGQRSLNEQVRAVLGEDRFYPYVEGADRNYAQVAQAFAAFPSVTPSAAYQVYGLQTELQALMIRNPNDGPPSPERIAEMRTTVEAYNQRLESLVGAEAAEAYRKQGAGRMFTSFRNPPRPAPSTQTPASGR